MTVTAPLACLPISPVSSTICKAVIQLHKYEKVPGVMTAKPRIHNPHSEVPKFDNSQKIMCHVDPHQIANLHTHTQTQNRNSHLPAADWNRHRNGMQQLRGSRSWSWSWSRGAISSLLPPLPGYLHSAPCFTHSGNSPKLKLPNQPNP